MQVQRNNISFLVRRIDKEGTNTRWLHPSLFQTLTFSKSRHHWTHFQATLRFWNEKQTNGKCDNVTVLSFYSHLNKPAYINALLVWHLVLLSKYAVTQNWFGIVWHISELNLTFLSSLTSHFYTWSEREGLNRLWAVKDLEFAGRQAMNRNWTWQYLRCFFTAPAFNKTSLTFNLKFKRSSHQCATKRKKVL